MIKRAFSSKFPTKDESDVSVHSGFMILNHDNGLRIVMKLLTIDFFTNSAQYKDVNIANFIYFILAVPSGMNKTNRANPLIPTDI